MLAPRLDGFALRRSVDSRGLVVASMTLSDTSDSSTRTLVPAWLRPLPAGEHIEAAYLPSRVEIEDDRTLVSCRRGHDNRPLDRRAREPRLFSCMKATPVSVVRCFRLRAYLAPGHEAPERRPCYVPLT